MLNPGTYLQNRYEILERIGSGGMSVVYKAQCHTLNRLVAIKVLKEEFVTDENFISKFKMEAQSAARLSHPNIVSVYDVVDEGELHYIVMELIEGITLKHYIEKKGFLENREATGIAIQVASGIAAAHEQHIIHRDIKPQNMIISKDGKVKVADFGIARAVSSQTVNATAVGSVHYISPEQARGGYCDERSDIYSFGITLYEMLTGKVPFEGDNTVAVALAHLEDPVIPPSDYNPDIWEGLEQIILKCTEKRPDDRYQKVSDVIADLRKVLMDPLTDLYEEEEEEKNVEIYKTRPISREELNSLQDAVAAKEEEDRIEASSRTQRKKRASRDHFEDDREDVTTQFDRIITVFGIIAAILIVAVVLFVFSRFIGLFDFKGTSTKESTAISTEASQGEVDVSISDNQTPMPDVLGLPEDMAEAKLKESTLVMRVAASEYSDNYPEGQVMSQEIAKGEIVEKWSTVDVTVSKGSDKVDLQKLSLLQMTAEEAQTLLRSKGLVVVRRDEVSATVEKGDVIRFSPDIAKVGESVTLFVSSGTQNVTGQVPALTGKDATTADALLAGAGLTVGTVTYEKSETVEEGLIISQSAAEGTTLEPGTAVDYVVSGTQPGGENSDQYYIGSIDTTCSLSNYIGPAAKTSSVRVLVRLKQTLNGDDVYTTLINARLVVGAQTIPIVIPRIKGAYGVDNGIVEVVDADNLNVISSYPVTFFPAG